jgi:hypothetical protein
MTETHMQSCEMETQTEIINTKPKKVKKTENKQEYFRNYMAQRRLTHKEHIERLRVLRACMRDHKLPSNRAIKIHNFTQEELNNIFANLKCNDEASPE